MFKIRQVISSEATIISEMAINSKAHWGYNKEFMDACVDELSHSDVDINNDAYCYFCAHDINKVIGFYKLENLTKPSILLEALFIDPNTIGKGVGRLLFEHATQTAREHGATYLEAQSDPYAESFYLAMGAKVIGQQKSDSIKDRFLPIIQLKL